MFGADAGSRIPPVRLSADSLAAQLQQFNARDEIAWFGFKGSFEARGQAAIRFARLEQGALGGGTVAVNGGVRRDLRDDDPHRQRVPRS